MDGSDASLAALRHAAQIAPKLDLPLHALVVWDYATFLYDATYSPELYSLPQKDAERVSQTSAAEVFPDAVPEWFTRSTEQGRPAYTLVQRSKEAAMLVVGSRGHGGFTGLLLGSVSAACVSHAHCPVLVVRDQGDSGNPRGHDG